MTSGVSQTFRIDGETYDQLVKEARAENKTINYTVSRALNRHVAKSIMSHLSSISIIKRPHLATLLEHISDEEIEDSGERLGAAEAQQCLSLYGLPPNPSSLEKSLQILSQDASWFGLRIIEGPNGSTYHLMNDLGWKWGKFLRGYLRSLAKGLSVAIKIEISEFNLALKPQTR